MNRYLISILFLCSLSCGSEQHQPEIGVAQLERKKSISANIVKITFSNGESFNWDNTKSIFIEDSLYSKIVSSFKKDHSFLLEEISNVKLADAVICSCHRDVVLGDFAFILIDKVENIPFFDIVGVQCDYFEKGCPYPEGYFEAINNNRSIIKNKLKEFLQ
jgi:hypothetical protein